MKSDTPVFKDAKELAETFEELKNASAPEKNKVRRRKASLTLFDVFENLRQATSREESDRIVKKHKLLSDLVAGKETRRLIHVKLNPSLVDISDEDGRVQVGDRVFDVLDEGETRELMRMMPQPEPEPGGGGSTGGTTGYVFTEAPPEDLVIALPCGPWTVLPGYPTQFFDATIGGRTVLVQLWKGSCPDYLGWAGSPGGVGAEVGLYNRHPWFPDLFWWPDAEHEKVIEFTLINPVTSAPFFSASSPGPIWWSHKWMKFQSYDQYVRDQHNNVPAKPEQYSLRSRIDGTSFEW